MKRIFNILIISVLLMSCGTSKVSRNDNTTNQKELVILSINDMHGKTLFVYTDGINEAENIHKEQFGDERLQALLKQDLGDARQTSETIHKAVEEFVGDAEPSDDLTKMCIKMKSA